MEERRFYVYIHRRKTDHKIFYVGKGAGKRYLTKSGRNNHWHNIVKKHGFYCEVIKKHLSEKDSLEIEVEIIKILREENIKLCNLSDGGEGTTGYKHTNEALLKIKNASLKNWKTEEYVLKIKEKSIETFSNPKVTDQRRSAFKKTWSNPDKRNLILERRKGENNPLNKKVYQYGLNGLFIKEYYSASEAAKLNKFRKSDIGECCRGDQKSAFGYLWSFEYFEKIPQYKKYEGENHNDSKPILRYSKDMKECKRYSSMSQAKKEGFCQANISSCCMGRRKSHKGFIWKYA